MILITISKQIKNIILSRTNSQTALSHFLICHTSVSPVFPVEAAVLDSFRQML